MPKYRVAFPDDQAWTITVKAGSEDPKSEAFTRANTARVLNGGSAHTPEECAVEKLTPQVRARLKGLRYLTRDELLQRCARIGSEYQRAGLGLTVRGLYYQLVSRGFLASGQSEYDRVKDTLAKARLSGAFPLGLLSDTSRRLHVGDATRYDLDVDRQIQQAGTWVRSLDRFFVEAAHWYRQPDLPIVLFEKEALANVFGPVCRELGVSWMATKGYPSVSTLHRLHELMLRSADPEIQGWSLEESPWAALADLNPAKRKPGKGSHMSEYELLLDSHSWALESLVEGIARGEGFWTDSEPEPGNGDAAEHKKGGSWTYRHGNLTVDQHHQGTGRTVRVLYFGDHDPDGMEIPHDLERRLRIIQVRAGRLVPFTVERLGLNRDQIEEHDPPPFWAKPSSARHPKYLREHAWARDNAWELDALDPRVLQTLVRQSVDAYHDAGIAEDVRDAVDDARLAFKRRMLDDVLPQALENLRAELGSP